MEYAPDCWVILKINNENGILHKVLAGWVGSYVGSDSWQLNSGITKIEYKGDFYLFHGYSGSVYKCRKTGYRLTGLTASILAGWKKEYPNKFELLDEGSIDVLRQQYG